MKTKITVKFYTDSNKYKGRKYLKQDDYLQISNWIDSNNYVVIQNKEYNWNNKGELMGKYF